jgi:hypothetical protein
MGTLLSTAWQRGMCPIVPEQADVRQRQGPPQPFRYSNASDNPDVLKRLPNSMVLPGNKQRDRLWFENFTCHSHCSLVWHCLAPMLKHIADDLLSSPPSSQSRRSRRRLAPASMRAAPTLPVCRIHLAPGQSAPAHRQAVWLVIVLPHLASLVLSANGKSDPKNSSHGPSIFAATCT